MDYGAQLTAATRTKSGWLLTYRWIGRPGEFTRTVVDFGDDPRLWIGTAWEMDGDGQLRQHPVARRENARVVEANRREAEKRPLFHQ